MGAAVARDQPATPGSSSVSSSASVEQDEGPGKGTALAGAVCGVSCSLRAELPGHSEGCVSPPPLLLAPVSDQAPCEPAPAPAPGSPASAEPAQQHPAAPAVADPASPHQQPLQPQQPQQQPEPPLPAEVVWAALAAAAGAGCCAARRAERARQRTARAAGAAAASAVAAAAVAGAAQRTHSAAVAAGCGALLSCAAAAAHAAAARAERQRAERGLMLEIAERGGQQLLLQGLGCLGALAASAAEGLGLLRAQSARRRRIADYEDISFFGCGGRMRSAALAILRRSWRCASLAIAEQLGRRHYLELRHREVAFSKRRLALALMREAQRRFSAAASRLCGEAEQAHSALAADERLSRAQMWRRARQQRLEERQRAAAVAWWGEKEATRERRRRELERAQESERRRRDRLRSHSLPKSVSKAPRHQTRSSSLPPNLLSRTSSASSKQDFAATCPLPQRTSSGGLLVEAGLLFSSTRLAANPELSRTAPPAAAQPGGGALPAVGAGGAPAPAPASRIIAPDVAATPQAVRAVVAAAQLRPGDVLYDVGCGGGALLHAVAVGHKQVNAVGIEIRANRAREAFELLASHSPRVIVLHADAMDADFSLASVVTLYMVPSALQLISRKLEREVKPGTRVVSLVFAIPGWVPVGAGAENGKARPGAHVMSYIIGQHRPPGYSPLSPGSTVSAPAAAAPEAASAPSPARALGAGRPPVLPQAPPPAPAPGPPRRPQRLEGSPAQPTQGGSTPLSLPMKRRPPFPGSVGGGAPAAPAAPAAPDIPSHGSALAYVRQNRGSGRSLTGYAAQRAER